MHPSIRSRSQPAYILCLWRLILLTSFRFPSLHNVIVISPFGFWAFHHKTSFTCPNQSGRAACPRGLNSRSAVLGHTSVSYKAKVLSCISPFQGNVHSIQNLDIITTAWTLRLRISTTSNRMRCPYQNLLGIISVFISRSRKSRIPSIFTGTPFPHLFFLLWPFHYQLLSLQSLQTPPI